jgi:hypothetical protein
MNRNRWKKWLLVLAFVASAVLTVVFAFRAVHRRPHPNRDEQIRPWMTITYVAHSYHVPPHVLYDALGIQHKPHDRLTVARVAREQNRPVHAVISDLMDAIARARPSLPPASPPGRERPNLPAPEPAHPNGSPSEPGHPSASATGPGHPNASATEPGYPNGSPPEYARKPAEESATPRPTL